MRLCQNAVILVCFVWGSAAVSAAPAGFEPADRALLAEYARDTWRSIAAMSEGVRLPADSLRRTETGWAVDGLTSPTNIAAYLWSTIAAEDFHLITSEESGKRIGQTLASLAHLERSHGFFYNWYDPVDGSRARQWPGGGELRPFLSVVDNGWLAAALIVVANARPEYRDDAEAILQPMNFAFFYDPYDPADPAAHPGLLRGGFWPDDNTFSVFHYGALNTEPRIASYIGIARGQLPAEHYFRMFRTSQEPPRNPPPGAANTYAGVAVNESSLNYRGIQLVPTWDGTMFEALMVSLMVPEADWAPLSWGANHPLYVKAQIEYGLRDAQIGYWGLSAACTPGGGYGAYGVAALGVRTHAEHSTRPKEAIIAPYASFLALPFAPSETLANLRALTAKFPVYDSFGFHDSVNVLTGQVSDRILVLDQGMILASLAGVIGNDPIRRGFCAGQVEATIRPLIALERFNVRVDPPSSSTAPKQEDNPKALTEEPTPSTDRSYRFGRPFLGRERLLGGLLTAAGLSAVFARRARSPKEPRPTSIDHGFE